ncbi:MAG: hypothetical protein ABIH00_03210 [Armatimonadota bacterium]
MNIGSMKISGQNKAGSLFGAIPIHKETDIDKLIKKLRKTPNRLERMTIIWRLCDLYYQLDYSKRKEIRRVIEKVASDDVDENVRRWADYKLDGK